MLQGLDWLANIASSTSRPAAREPTSGAVLYLFFRVLTGMKKLRVSPSGVADAIKGVA